MGGGGATMDGGGGGGCSDAAPYMWVSMVCGEVAVGYRHGFPARRRDMSLEKMKSQQPKSSHEPTRGPANLANQAITPLKGSSRAGRHQDLGRGHGEKPGPSSPEMSLRPSARNAKAKP